MKVSLPLKILNFIFWCLLSPNTGFVTYYKFQNSPNVSIFFNFSLQIRQILPEVTNFKSVSSVAQFYLTLCDPMDYRTPGLPVHHQLPDQSLLKFMSIESLMPSNYLILCCPILLLPSIFRSIRVFLNESALRMRWPKYWSFSFNISPSKEYSGLIYLGWTGWISLQSKGFLRIFSNTTVQKHQFFSAQPSL